MKRIGLIVLSVLLVWSMLCIPAVADPAETPEPQLEVRFSQESAVRGETITADIILHNNPGIAAINFHIGHDANLKLTEYADSQLTDWVVGVNEGENAVWVNSKTFTGDGSILKLVFQVSEAIPNTANVKLTVSAEGLKTYDLNENEVYFTVKPATISVKPVICEENAHVWDSGKTTVFPSYSMPGEKTFTCTVCGSHKTEAIPKLQEHCIHACATCGGCTGKTLCEGFKPCTCQDSDGAPETKPVEGCSVISISVDLVLKVNKIENAPKVTESIENAVNNLNDKTNASSEPGDNLQLGEITALYDVMLQDTEGNEYELEEANVTVTLQVGKDNANALKIGTMVLVHFGKNGDVIYGVNKQGTEMLTVNEDEGTATFTTDGFSPFALLKVSEHEATGVTVSGTITSYGSASEAVTVTLLQGTSVIGSPQVLTTGVSGTAPYSQSYTFPAVPAGDYTLKVEKKGHAPFTKGITVGSSSVTENVTVYLIGDVNGDGEVNAIDLQWVKQKILNKRVLSEQQLLVADVNKDGAVNAIDLQWIKQRILNKRNADFMIMS